MGMFFNFLLAATGFFSTHPAGMPAPVVVVFDQSRSVRVADVDPPKDPQEEVWVTGELRLRDLGGWGVRVWEIIIEGKTYALHFERPELEQRARDLHKAKERATLTGVVRDGRLVVSEVRSAFEK